MHPSPPGSLVRLVRPPLFVHVRIKDSNTIAARAELQSRYGPILLSAEVPLEMVRHYIELQVIGPHQDQIQGDEMGCEEIGSFFSKLRDLGSHVVHTVAAPVLKATHAAIEATHLPQAAQAIQRHVKKLTGMVPGIGLIKSAFKIASRAMQGDFNAKRALLAMIEAAKHDPSIRVALATVKVTAKLLPYVKPLITTAAAFVPALGPVATGVTALDALNRGDWAALAKSSLLLAPGGATAATALAVADAIRQGDFKGAALSAVPGGETARTALHVADSLRQGDWQNALTSAVPGGAQAMQAARIANALRQGDFKQAVSSYSPAAAQAMAQLEAVRHAAPSPLALLSAARPGGMSGLPRLPQLGF